ncbi:MAG: type II secretion system F family protein [Planctomycetia bacterium]|nr:type II secretion system F family protein [Planctomycetia bacterium]
MLLPLATFVAVTFGLVGVYWLALDLLRNRLLVSQRLREEFTPAEAKTPRSPLFKPLPAETGFEAEPARDGFAEPAGGFLTRLQRVHEQSGLPGDLTALAAVGLALGVCGGGLVGWQLGAALGVLAGVAGVLLPFLYLYYRWKARLELLMGQLPDAFDLMARTIRAGHSVPQALQSVSEEFEPPIAVEFSYCREQQQLGLLPEVVYRELARRTNVLEIKIFVMALLIQQQTGGNLAELLERLATLVRERLRIRGHIKALTGEGRLQAVVLLLLPPGMFVLLLALYPDYAGQLLDHPALLAGMLCSMAVGAFWIHRIVNFDF